MMTGSVTEMGEAYEREWARQWEVLNEPVSNQSDDDGPFKPDNR
jgi:hypothetical protein